MSVFLAALAVLSNACYLEVSTHGGTGWDEAQNVAQLYDPPVGCEDGPLSLELRNDTDFYLQMTIDGMEIDFLGGNAAYAEFPPWTSAFLCLDNLGTHTLTGVAFVERYGQLREVQGDYRDFSVRQEFGANIGYGSRQQFRIDPGVLYYH